MRVAFRVDAAPWIGTGHVMRCLSLANRMRESGWEVRFISRHIPVPLADRVRSSGVALTLLPPFEGGEWARPDNGYASWLRAPKLRDATDTIDTLVGKSWDWIVVDHYSLDEAWEEQVGKVTRARVLAIDDLANRRHAAAVLLDQNLIVNSAERYAKLLRDGTVALLGPQYALLSAEFVKIRAEMAPRDGSVENVMVMFGGADDTNATADAVEALGRLKKEVRVVVVVGAAYAHLTDLKTRCEDLGFELHYDSSNVAQLMQHADFSVGAAGSTSWERCCLGVPAVCVPCAENQHPIAAGLRWAGTAVVASRDDLKDSDGFASLLDGLFINDVELRSLSNRARALVDGQGTTRVLHIMETAL